MRKLSQTNLKKEKSYEWNKKCTPSEDSIG